MRSTKLALAAALALATGVASSSEGKYIDVALDAKGLGQGLIFPYFTTNNGQSTLLAVQNTSAKGKAVKLTVRNATDGSDTLSVNVYIPPFGRWSGALTRESASASSRLIAGIPSVGCTVPAMPAAGFELRVTDFSGEPLDVHEGSVDIVEMGTLNEFLSAQAREGSEASCAEFTSRANPQSGVWATVPNEGIEAPTGGLKGSATLLDVSGGTAFSYDAPAFTGLAYKARHTTFDPDRASRIDFVPTIADIQTPPDAVGMQFTVRRSDGSPVTLRYSNNGLPERPIWGFAVIGSLLATTQANANVFLDENLRARTEWIVSFPTYAVNGEMINLPALPPDVLLQPPFHYVGETLGVKAWDIKGSPLPALPPVFVGKAVNVIRFVHGDAPAGHRFSTADSPTIELGAPSATVQLDFKSFVGNKLHHFQPSEACTAVVGLPAWVLAVQSYDNDNAQQGRIATFPVEERAAGPVEVVDCTALE